MRFGSGGAKGEGLIDLPRVSLGLYPTPLVAMKNLSRLLEIDLYLKDESQSWFALGGNKIRAIEYLFADSAAWDSVILAGGPQSNFIRAAAIAALILGKSVVGSFYGTEPKEAYGNYQLLKLAGIDVHFSNSPARESSESLAGELKLKLEASGRRVKVIPRGGALMESVFGFYQFQLELEGQLASQESWGHLVLPVGSGTTIAGLLMDDSRMKNVGQIWGISCSRPWASLGPQVFSLIDRCCEKSSVARSRKTNFEVTDHFLGSGYGVWTPELRDCIQLVLRHEGVFLDPVFGAKAFLGLLGLIKEERIEKGASVVFIHGGGSPELFSAPNRVHI